MVGWLVSLVSSAYCNTSEIVHQACPLVTATSSRSSACRPPTFNCQSQSVTLTSVALNHFGAATDAGAAAIRKRNAVRNCRQWLPSQRPCAEKNREDARISFWSQLAIWWFFSSLLPLKPGSYYFSVLPWLRLLARFPWRLLEPVVGWRRFTGLSCGLLPLSTCLPLSLLLR